MGRKILRVFNYTLWSGTTSSVVAGQLVDANAKFMSVAGVRVGDVVEKETDLSPNPTARVTAVLSETELQLDQDIFTAAGEKYRIRRGFVHVTGTVTAVSAGQLVDANADFVTAGVRGGFVVTKEDAQGTILDYAWVTSVVDANTLQLSKDLFSAVGESYRVYDGEVVHEGFFDDIEQELHKIQRYLAADDTELSSTSTVGEVLKSFRFLVTQNGIQLGEGTLYVALEARADTAAGTLEVRIDGTTVITFNVATNTAYDLYEASYDLSALNLSQGAHTFELVAIAGSGGTLWTRCLEVWASE